MLKDITLGQFFPGDTFIHRLDPRTKLIAVILYIVALFNAKGVVTYAMVMAVLVLCIAAAVFVFTGAMSASIALLGDAADSAQYLQEILRNGFVTFCVIFMLAAGAAAPIFLFNKRAHSLTRDKKHLSEQ